MRLAYVNLCGFRGYQKAVHFEFAENFTVIDGRNGVGKIELLTDLSRQSQDIQQVREDLIQLTIAVRSAMDALNQAEEERNAKARAVTDIPDSSELSKRARQLE
jgi:predicted ATP-binding protein involved in virulence